MKIVHSLGIITMGTKGEAYMASEVRLIFRGYAIANNLSLLDVAYAGKPGFWHIKYKG